MYMQYTESKNSLILTDLELESNLFNSIIPEVEVIAIAPEENNPETITEVISAYTNITDLHLVGDSEDWISTFQQTPELGQYFSDNATIYFYEYQDTTGTLHIQDQLLLSNLLLTSEDDNTLEVNNLTESVLVETVNDSQSADKPATVTTDLADYPPGSTATITGENFDLGETIELQVLHTDGTPNTGGGHEPWLVTDGGKGDLDGIVDGNLRTEWYVNPDDSLNSTFELTAVGQTSQEIATYTFTDSDPAVQFFYVPEEEEDIKQALIGITSDFSAVTGIETVISLTVSTDNSIIYYDHWEDGYESDLDNPTQSSTQVWGDNDPSNGIAPGFTTDVLNAGDIIALENTVTVPRDSNAIFYDRWYKSRRSLGTRSKCCC